MTIACAKSRFPFFSERNSEQVVCVAEIDFREASGPLDSVEKFGSQWQRVSVLDRYAIQGTVIDAKPEAPVLLLDEQHRSAERRRGGSNESLRKVFFDVILQSGKLGLREVVDGAKGWFRSFLERDSMIQGSPVRRQGVSFLLREDLGQVSVF